MVRALRYLRIAFSAACVIACGLVLALSVRSHRTIDLASGHLYCNHNYEAISVSGIVKLTIISSRFRAPTGFRTIAGTAREADVVEDHVRHFSSAHGFGLYDRHALTMPYWFVAVTICLLALVPWLSFHFGLRTLLIAITLLSAAMGAVTMLSRE